MWHFLWVIFFLLAQFKPALDNLVLDDNHESPQIVVNIL